MKIEMNDIESHIAGTNDTHNSIQVCSVIVAEAAAVMDDLGDLADVFVKQPYCVRVGEHQSCDIIAGSFLQLFDIYAAIVSGRDADYCISCHGSTCRIRSVCGVRDQDLGFMCVAFAGMICFHQQQPGQLAVGACCRLEGHVIHAGDLTKVFFCQSHDFHASLHSVLRLQRMDLIKAF